MTISHHPHFHTMVKATIISHQQYGNSRLTVLALNLTLASILLMCPELFFENKNQNKSGLGSILVDFPSHKQ